MTKEDWQRIKVTLAGARGAAVLQIGEYEIFLSRQLVGKNQLGIVTFVNKALEKEWVDPEKPCPEQQFLCKRERWVWSAKTRALAKKMTKKQLQRHNCDPTEKRPYYDPCWTSFTALQRHYQKTFPVITMIKVAS